MTRRSALDPAHHHRFVLQGRAATARPDRAFVEYVACPDCFAVRRRTYHITGTRLTDETIVAQGPVADSGKEDSPS